MKTLHIILIALLIGCQSTTYQTNLNYEQEVERISQVATAFSKALIEDDVTALMKCYAEDAIIFPPRLDQLSDSISIRSYWTSRSERDVIYHMIIPERIEMHDSTAIDFGEYEGQSIFDGDTLDPFQGKYVVVWKLDNQNNWKIKYDIWNSSPSYLDTK